MKGMKKIGITCRTLAYAQEKLGKDCYLIGGISYYIEAVRAVGGMPILLPVSENKKEKEQYLELVDGIIFTGGTDIDPSFYGADQHIGIETIDFERDVNDFEYMDLAFAVKKPIYAICRGMQLLNVFQGGTLFQDLREIQTNLNHLQQGAPTVYAHDIKIVEQTKAFSMFGKRKIFGVNSFHHQVVDQIGENLIVAGRARDNAIEILELDATNHFVIGVQFHPEMFVQSDDSIMKQSFAYFLKQC